MNARLREWTRYDISKDREVVMFTAATERGSYWAELPCDSEKTLRELREEFKQSVAECIQRGQPPCQLEMEEA